MKEPPGYLLPAGDAYTDELACTLVFYPDKPEYRRALLGSIVYLSNWLAWERDSEKRGKDAARAWKGAVDETLECWTMACFEELMADVARIRDLLETKKDCCDDSVAYYPTEEPTTEIVPLVGDPPEYYGETAVTDWDDWQEHVCYNAHAYVDYLISTSGQLYNAVEVSSIFMGLIAAALALLAFSGIGLPIAFGLAAFVVSGLALSATILTFADTASDFEDARDEIVCAIVMGYSVPEAVESALGSNTAWDLFYQWVDYASAMAIVYEGGYGSEYLPTETRDDCLCVGESRFIFQWPTDVDGWVQNSLNMTWDVGQFVTCTPNTTGAWRTQEFWPWTSLATRFSFSLPISYDQVRFKFNNHSDEGAALRQLFQFYIRGEGDEAVLSPVYDTDDFTDDEWHEIIWNFDDIYYSGVGANQAITFRMYRYGPATEFRRLWLDDFGLYLK
jgi:hypothetical protein